MIRSKYFITLLFLLFVFGSCGVVSFGMKENDNENEIKIKNENEIKIKNENEYDYERSQYIGEYYDKVLGSLENINKKDQYKSLIDKYEKFLEVGSFLKKDPVKVSSKEYKNTLNEILDKEDKRLLRLETKCFLIKAYCNVLTDFVKRKIKNIINNYEEKYDYSEKNIKGYLRNLSEAQEQILNVATTYLKYFTTYDMLCLNAADIFFSKPSKTYDQINSFWRDIYFANDNQIQLRDFLVYIKSQLIRGNYNRDGNWYQKYISSINIFCKDAKNKKTLLCPSNSSLNQELAFLHVVCMDCLLEIADKADYRCWDFFEKIFEKNIHISKQVSIATKIKNIIRIYISYKVYDRYCENEKQQQNQEESVNNIYKFTLLLEEAYFAKSAQSYDFSQYREDSVGVNILYLKYLLDLGVDHNNEFKIDNFFCYYSFWKHTLPPLVFSGLLAGIGGYNNDFKTLYECKVGALTIYMHNYILGCGVNFKLKLPYSLKFISDHLNIHLLGWNLIPLFCSIATVLLWDFLYLKKGSDEIKTEPNENIENKEKKVEEKKVEESIIGRIGNCIGNVFSVALYGNRMIQKYDLANILGCDFCNDNTPLMFMFTSRLLLDTVQCISIEIPLINGHCSIMLNLGTTLIALIIGKLYEERIVSEDYIYKTILPQSSILFDNIKKEAQEIRDANLY